MLIDGIDRFPQRRHPDGVRLNCVVLLLIAVASRRGSRARDSSR